jgi:hypothetical protein
MEQLYKLQEELSKQFTSLSKVIEEQIQALGAANGPPVPTVPREVYLDKPQQATRPNTPTSTSAYSTSSCTSRTPPATNGSDHRSGHRSTRLISEAGKKENDSNARESTLQKWSDLGDTLQQVVQRNLKLEEDNRKLQQEIKEIDNQVASLQTQLAERGASAHGTGIEVSMADSSQHTELEDGSALDERLKEWQQPVLAAPMQAPQSTPGLESAAVLKQPAVSNVVGRFTLQKKDSSPGPDEARRRASHEAPEDAEVLQTVL